MSRFPTVDVPVVAPGRGLAVRLGVGAALVDGSLVPGDVEVVDGRIAGVGLSSPNGTGIAAPGFVDLQVNGFAGVDFFSADAEGYRKGGRSVARVLA